ncbi:MAG: AAA family ATPase, partial [Spirochaetales bacterium]|nr:AAA family ATPase [Spirochaetales bacterium]
NTLNNLTAMNNFTFNISLSVLNHLGRNLYRSFITVLGEAISNSWDAEADNVWIYLDREENFLVIKDDGNGMSENDFQTKFLKIGYSKRKDGENKTPNKNRPYIGRKGIGKLALLSCAKRISVITKTNDTEFIGGIIDNSGLDQAIEDDLTPQEYPLETIDISIKLHYYTCMVLRERYLKQIRPFYNSEMIKVIMGVRRCGKSTLLRQIIDELQKQKQIGDENIIYMNFEDYQMRHLFNPDILFAYVESKIDNAKQMYLFFDEIQNVDKFELVLNSFRSTHKKVSIFITGSNTKLLSGELATHLGGRTVSFTILPFSFKEFLELKGSEKNHAELFTEYVEYGGFPLVCKENSIETKAVQLKNLYDSIVYKDIIRNNKFSSAILLEKVLNYFIANSSTTVSVKNMLSELLKEGISISIPTMYEYINLFKNSGLIQMVPRYDIRGKRILAFHEKTYVCDLGLFSFLKNRVKEELSFITETLVYNELISRAYAVYIGKTYKGEVDFIAESPDGKKCYIQVAYLMETDATRDREFGAFLPIKDNYPKYVISQDPIKLDRDGIKHLELIDFLLDENSLY